MEGIILPTTKNETVRKSPRKLVIYSPPKTGKTTLAAELENCLLLDLEQGSDFVHAMSLQANSTTDIHNICEEIKKAGKPYEYIAIDTATGLESMVMPLALKMYQQTPMGKSYTDHILNLPNGAGYFYVRQAYELMLNKIQDVCQRTILFGHIKDKLIEKGGKEVNAKDIDLTGKLRSIVCAGADAIGYLSREGDRCIITFKTSDEITCGARPEHLRNQTFVLSEKIGDKIHVYWNKIYID